MSRDAGSPRPGVVTLRGRLDAQAKGSGQPVGQARKLLLGNEQSTEIAESDEIDVDLGHRRVFEVDVFHRGIECVEFDEQAFIEPNPP